MTKAIVIGGGFYGATIAAYLKTVRGFAEVVLLERAGDLLTRSSFANQARVHNGYHYPRSFTTAYRSVVNAPRFAREFGPAIKSDFVHLYALARRNSKVTPRQMERFCLEIGAPLEPAEPELARLFDPARIQRVYRAAESAFDADTLRRLMRARLAAAGVETRFGVEVERVYQTDTGVRIAALAHGQPMEFTADIAFNCTYSGLQSVLPPAPPLPLKYEIAEMVLVEPPAVLKGLGVTVMDGPFFSLMPFPARDLHTLSHVRYTPHRAWTEAGSSSPYAVLDAYARDSRYDWMIRDAARYLPAIAACQPRASLFEVKTVLVRNEGDDGRPIFFERHAPFGRLVSVLGGKIDNVYDILERLDHEQLP